jgi:hypothetical protein
MMKLAILDVPHTFPPRTFLLTVWIATFLCAVFGIVATPGYTLAIYAWLVISLVSLWQLWTLWWVQLNRDGIRVRNIFGIARTLRWDEITNFKEEEVRLNKGVYRVIRISNLGGGEQTRITKITLTNDQRDFTTMCEIVRSAVGDR